IDADTFYVRANCHASMKKQKYQVFVCMSATDSSTIQHGYCQCPIGLAQTCSHIGSVLFALTYTKPLEKSCTSIPCTWNVPGRAVKPIGPMSSLPQRKPKLPVTATKQVATSHPDTYDPHHTCDRVVYTQESLHHLRNLKDVFPNTGMSHLWNIGDHVPEAIQEEEIEAVENPMFIKMKNMIYSNSNCKISLKPNVIY
ncbi:uncharacterized protein LOC117319262, partial [Pecten maximus]|uniref:uncharacterized protein LOC117319262 n=1 Tax=Pecten maximus TaxID=6579 RepID=UPI00145912F4